MSLSLPWPVMTDSRQGESDAPSPLIPLSPSGFSTQCFADRPLKCVATQIQLHHADILVVLWKKKRPPAVAFASSSINTLPCSLSLKALEIPAPSASHPDDTGFAISQ